MNKQLSISVIIPVYNAGSYLAQCLDALQSACNAATEVIVVDDGSTDGCAEVHREGVEVYRLPLRSGPAAARNFGARHAKGEILLFVDADVVVRPDTVDRVAQCLSTKPEFAAVFGSYDERPPAKGFISQYKNLQHHFVHQHANSEAATFWSGCGGIRRDVFASVGGFNERRYSAAAIEDIELGSCLRRAGHRILLDRELKVTHLKHWTFFTLVRADIFSRAFPWSELMIENREVINDLNVRTKDRICAVLVGFLPLFIALAFFHSGSLLLAAFALLAICVLNRELYIFFCRQRGLTFAAGAFAMHLLYYFYSGCAFSLCWVRNRFGGISESRPVDSSNVSESISSNRVE